MTFEKRLTDLEKTVDKIELDPKLDKELSEWFKANPEYHPFVQTEDGKDIMPKKLGNALRNRMKYLCKKHNLDVSLSNLLKIDEDVFY